MDLRCSTCGRPAPATASSEILVWQGGEMSLVTHDPLMLSELVCPLCKAQKTEGQPPRRQCSGSSDQV
jgi:hypothetical protein